VTSVVLGGALLWFLTRAVEVPLHALPQLPEAPPEASSQQTPWVWPHIHLPPTDPDADLREVHNRQVKALQALVEQVEAGEASLRDAEWGLMRIHATRLALGASTPAEAHSAWRRVLRREVARIETLARMEPPRASDADIHRARAFAERSHWHLTGDASVYGPMRRAVLDRLDRRIKRLREAQDDRAVRFVAEREAFAKVLPDPDTATPACAPFEAPASANNDQGPGSDAATGAE